MTSRSAPLALAWLLLLTAAPAIASSGGDTDPCPSPDADDSSSFCEDYHCSFRYLNKRCYCGPSIFRRTVSHDSPWLQRSRLTGHQSCTIADVQNANAQFQRSFDLAPTGECDNATRHVMLNPRCLPNRNDAAAGHQHAASATVARSSSSLDSILRGTPRDSAMRQRRKRAVAAAGLREASKPPLHDVRSNYWGEAGASNDRGSTGEKGSGDESTLPTQVSPKMDIYRAPPVVSASSDDLITHERNKRQTYANGTSSALPTNGSASFSTMAVRWRITSYSQRMSQAEQDAALTLAFRQWATITPLCFIRDTTSDINQIQAKVAFYEGAHPGDVRNFDGPGGELAHTLPGAFVHFDASEDWYSCITSAQGTGTCLYTVALHEIGHLIGLPHLPSLSAVMFPYYNVTSQNRVLSDADRKSALSKYGACNGSFDTIIDIVFSVAYVDDEGNLRTDRYFSTYFFRRSFVWYYRNSLGRAYEDQPRPMSEYWGGLPYSVDAICEFSSDTDDVVMVFKGSTVYLFNYTLNKAGNVYSSYAISSYFKTGALGEPIPNNIDSCYFDPRDGYMYFFKGSWVYTYNYNPQSNHSCCVGKSEIKTLFPPATADQVTVLGLTYQLNIDAVYISIFYNTQYFFVGNQVWKNENFDYYGSDAGNNSVIYMGPWNSLWGFICDVTC